MSRNCSRTSWKTGRVAAEREPEDTEPFSSTTSDSPHLCEGTIKNKNVLIYSYSAIVKCNSVVKPVIVAFR